MTASQLALFKTLIKQRCGLMFDGSGEAKLVHALDERMAACDLEADRYCSRLLGDAGEFQQLVNLLTVNETYFFREAEQIRLLVESLAPRFLAARAGREPVRILSAGCSSGEEPYSLAMALMERYGADLAHWFSIVGVDIDSAVLAKARAGRYTDFSFRGVSDEVCRRYFERDAVGSLLKDEVRRQVIFHQANLLAENVSPLLQDFDIVFFRNVSIYFDAPTRQHIQQKLARLMKADGILVAGLAETHASDLGVFSLVEEEGLFYFAKGNPPLAERTLRFDRQPAAPLFQRVISDRPLPAPSPESFLACGTSSGRDRARQLAESCAVAPAPSIVVPADCLAQAREEVRGKRYAPALALLDAVLAQQLDHQEACLLKAHVLLQRRAFTAAEELARRVLANDAWSVDAFMVLGLAAKWRDEETEAIRWLKQAVYASHACWPAHYFLADLLRASGSIEPARRAYRIVIQRLSGDATETGLRYLPLDLPSGEVRFLCEHRLAQLSIVATADVVG